MTSSWSAPVASPLRLALLAVLVLAGGRWVVGDEGLVWPEKGPKQEGRTVLFPHHGVRWTLPEETPFEWLRMIEDESVPEGLLAVAGYRSTEASGVARLFARPVPRSIELDQIQPETIAQMGLHLLADYDKNRVKVETHAPIGNFEGTLFEKVGTAPQNGKPAFYRGYSVYVKGVQFLVEFVVTGTEEGRAAATRAVEPLLAGLEWVDTKRWVRGPFHIPGTAPTDRPIGPGLGEEKSVSALGIDVTKPEEFSEIQYDLGVGGSAIRFAWEAWTEDRFAYMAFTAHSWLKREFANNRDFLEGIARQRLEILVPLLPSGATEVVKEKRSEILKVSFAKKRGVGYEVRTTFIGSPAVEKGYLVETSKHYYYFTVQFVGEKAEERFKALLSKIEKKLRLQ